MGRGRTDLLVLWPRETGQPSDLWERFVVECKVLRDTDRKSLAWTVEKGVEQALGYMKQCGAEEGHLVVMDRRSEARRRSEERRHGDGETDGSERQREGEGLEVSACTMAARWPCGRYSASTGEHGPRRKARRSGKPPPDTERLASPPPRSPTSPPPAASKTVGENRRNNPALRGAGRFSSGEPEHLGQR